MKQFSRFSQMYGIINAFGESTDLEHFHSVTWQPLVDIYEQDDTVVIVVELPGVDKEEIDVTIEHEILRITGMRPKRIPDATQHVHQMEIPYGRFTRLVKLPASSNVDNVEAEYSEGYLTITIPRMRKDD